MGDPFQTGKAGAEAISEVAKTTGKVVDAGRELGRWFEGKVGRTLEDLVGIALGDPLAFKRAESLLRRRERLLILARRSQAKLASLGIEETATVCDRVAVPLLEYAALEDDPTLQEMWANLLAMALDPGGDVGSNHVAILRDLSPTGALALRDYYLRTDEALRPPYPDKALTYDKETLDGDMYGVETARELFRLGLVEPATVYLNITRHFRGRGLEPDEFEDQEVGVPGDLYRITLTITGRDFCRAVGLEAPKCEGAASAK